MFSIASMLSPTLNFEVGQIATYPVVVDSSFENEVHEVVDDLVRSSARDWDSFETSWHFRKHPLL